MNPGRHLLGAADSLADRLLCVIGAVIFSQGPEFMQQYLQRLGGHLDEALRQVAQFRHAASQSGLSLDRLITQTSTNADPAVARLGGVMTDTVTRADALQMAHDALLHASLWTRPFVFARHFDSGIAQATWGVFQPAVPTTPEGLIYALLGMFILLGFYHLGLKRPFTRRSRHGLEPVTEHC